MSTSIQMDDKDPLVNYRNQFFIPQKNNQETIYLCGNSLGLQPKRTEKFITEELKNWKEKGVEGHFDGPNPWTKYHNNAKKSLGAIVGAKEHEVVAMNNLTTNLHLALATFYQPKKERKKILIEGGAFPSDYYAVHSQLILQGLDPSEYLVQIKPIEGEECISTSEIEQQIENLGNELALVLLPGIQYYTGQFFDIKAITATAHKVGAMVGFDLAHAVGNVPLSLHDDQVDFAVWCSYKYMNSGPGAVGGLYIHENHATNKDLPRMSGWWGHDEKARFKMDNTVNHIPNVDGWQLSNMNIIAQAAHLASLQIFDEVGMPALRQKSLKLTAFLEELIVDSEILGSQVKIITPSNPEERGCQLSIFLLNHGKAIFDFLIAKGVILDWREPNVIRVAPTPLYNTFEDVRKFVQILEEAIASEK